MLARAKIWARAIRQDVLALWIAARDPRTPWYAKAAAAAVAAYALSPIDLIPDFIPVLGYLDDLIIVPLGIVLVVRLIPGPLMAEYRAEAAGRSRPSSMAGMVAIGLIWVAAAVLLLWWLWPGGVS
ncbi:YkvA family protein [Ancylobacter sp. MQZ15Z-1]|uniref:YkvA family protein n=1 Tax=Ancylobacter mangrovi TaxID=2972472 RepID=A0A9X2PB96_9HYPH|nr:YkvA family protein [Ancylobacter mangrovi]MCS0494224.1 YkvA family protein [Ancylobacter mangrovi]